MENDIIIVGKLLIGIILVIVAFYFATVTLMILSASFCYMVAIHWDRLHWLETKIRNLFDKNSY